MRVFLVTIFLSIFIGTLVLADMPKTKTPGIQFEQAKRVQFKRKGCRPPQRESFLRFWSVMRFTLEPADIGKCGGDNKPKYSYDPPAPYVERVELSGTNHPQGKRYMFSALVHFDPKFTSSHRTTFFTVHQWDSLTCNCSPYVRIAIHQDGGLYAWVLKRPTKPEVYRLDGWTRADFEKRWVEVAVDIDTSAKQVLTVYVGGRAELTTTVLVREGGKVYPKVGLLRPGRLSPQLPADRVHIQDVRFARLQL